MYDFVRLSGFGRLRGVGHGGKLPGSIIGMLLLTAFLQMGWVKLRWVKGISDFSKQHGVLFSFRREWP